MCAGVRPVAPRAAPKPRLVSGRKPASKAGGLGVKRMSKQVDQSLFDQAPEEQAQPPVAVVRASLDLAASTMHTHSLEPQARSRGSQYRFFQQMTCLPGGHAWA